MIHDGWLPYDNFADAVHQQCLGHLLRRCQEMGETAMGGAVIFPRRVKDLLQSALDLRDRHAVGEVSDHGRRVATGRLRNELAEWVIPTKTNAANERLACLAAARCGRDELASGTGDPVRGDFAEGLGRQPNRGGSAAQGVLMSVWRTCCSGAPRHGSG